MKRFLILLVGAFMCVALRAQVLETNESAQVYYSPKTTLSLNFSYTVEIQERGIYADFAEDLLGATDAVKETATTYVLKSVQIGTSTATDYSRPHKVANDAGFPVLLNINDKGLLTGYNVAPEGKKDTYDSHKDSQKPNHHPKKPKGIAPLPEEALKAATTQAQAFEVAKQIFHLRETRMYLLNGEVEHAPADGRAMELVLEELDNQERALTELFIGKRHQHKEHKTIRVEPTHVDKLLYFSDENGFTDSENIDATVIRVRMECQRQMTKAANPKDKKKKNTELSPIVYNIPGHCDVTVTYQGRTIGSRSLPIAQFGIDVALPMNLFTGKDLPKIRFSEKTGNIQSITK